MLLMAVDIGNTNVVIGFIDDGRIAGTYRITTKANPQIMVAASSMSLYTKPGICLFSVTASHYSTAFRVSPGYCQLTGAQRNLVDGCGRAERPHDGR